MDLNIASHQTGNYTVQIPVYEGPLDLLLQLIERAELDITSVALAMVTDQYLKYICAMQEARAEEISEKYLSQIIIPLKGIGLVRSTRGAHGGYALAKPPAEITLREIVDILEGDCLIDCLKNSSCLRMASCASRDVWAMLGLKIAAVLQSVTLEELLRREREKTGRYAGGNI